MSPQTLAALGMYEGVANSHVKQLDQNDQHEMVKVLLEGAIQQKKSIQVTKAQKIIFGLRRTLNFEKGGEIASQLDSLYDYYLRTLTVAHAGNNSKKFLEVAGILEELLSGWNEIKK